MFKAHLVVLLSLALTYGCQSNGTETTEPAAPDYVTLQAETDARFREELKSPSDMTALFSHHPQAWLDRWVADPTPENEQAYLEALKSYKEKFEELTN